MLSIQDLTFRYDSRTLFEAASAQIASGWKVGLVGRNGTGKSTLMRLVWDAGKPGVSAKREEAIRIVKGATLGHVAQEVAPTRDSLLDVVLAADTERAQLMAEAETAEDPHRIAEIYTRLADIDAYSAEARASEILVGLGFRQEDLGRSCSEFSGGWRMRAALGGVLFSSPDLLLLDEPTNYLDLEGAAWLETYLRKYPKTVLIISHDRALLNRSVTHILAVEQTKLVVSSGGYDAYLKRRAERSAHLEGLKSKQDAQREHLQAFVDRFKAKASKARQAQSRVKMLEKMQEISIPVAERTVPFRFEDPDPLPSPILELERADLGYSAGRPVLQNVNLRLDQDDRIGIVGANGQGKTTLVKSIAERLKLLHGGRRASKNLRIGYFSQDQLDELRAGESVLEHVRDLDRQAGQAKVRAMAAQMGFGAEKVETKVEKLSGGEKVRLLLGLTTYVKPHILILDEPTSHLDIDSREALIYALNDYKGAVLLITHDTYLAEATADRLWLVKDGKAAPYDGDIADYKTLVLAADRTEQRARSPAHDAVGGGNGGGGAPATPHQGGAARGAAPKKPSMKLRLRVETAEKDMARLKAELEKIDAEIAMPGTFDNPAKAELRLKARAETQAQLDAAEAEWLDASEALEG